MKNWYGYRKALNYNSLLNSTKVIENQAKEAFGEDWLAAVKKGAKELEEAGEISGAGNILNSLNKLIGKTSSENILWKNIDETNIIWSNPNGNVLSTAKTFAN